MLRLLVELPDLAQAPGYRAEAYCQRGTQASGPGVLTLVLEDRAEAYCQRGTQASGPGDTRKDHHIEDS